MATLGNDDRVLGDFVTTLLGTDEDDVITLSGLFNLPGTFIGVIDGGEGYDLLQLDSANIAGEEGSPSGNAVLVTNIEETVLVSDGFYSLEAGDIVEVGELSFGDGVTDVFMSLSGQNAAIANFSGLTLEEGEALTIGFTTKSLGSSPFVDFSSASVAEDASIFYTGDIGSDIYLGSSGRDHVNGFGGNDTLYGFGGDDVLEAGFGGDNELYGGHGDDELRGGSGSDLMDGGFDDDLLIGGAGNDGLIGRQGRDTLIGGEGDDQILGGFGADVFVWATLDDGLDHVFDFRPFRDRIGFDNGLLDDGALAPEDVFSAIAANGGSLLIHDDTGDALAYFEDVNPSLLEFAIRNATLFDLDGV